MGRSEAVRQAAFEADGHRCQFCGFDPRTDRSPFRVLSGAHLEALGIGGSDELDVLENVITACWGPGSCHEAMHAGLLMVAMFDRAGHVLDAGRRKHVNDAWESYPMDELFFYQREHVEKAERAIAMLQQVGEIDGEVARMFRDLGAGCEMLAYGGPFDQVVSSLGWDPLKAGQIVEALDWADGWFGWPDGVPYSKVKLIMEADVPATAPPDMQPTELLRQAAAGASYTVLKKALQDHGYVARPMAYYLVQSGDVWGFVKTRREDELHRFGIDHLMSVVKVATVKGDIRKANRKESLKGETYVRRSTKEAFKVIDFAEFVRKLEIGRDARDTL